MLEGILKTKKVKFYIVEDQANNTQAVLRLEDVFGWATGKRLTSNVLQ